MFVAALRRHLELARRGLLTPRRFPIWLDAARREARLLEILEAEEASLTAAELRRFEGALDRWDREFKAILIERLIAGLADAGLIVGEPEKDDLLLDQAVRRVLYELGIVTRVDDSRGGVRGRRLAEVVQAAERDTRTERADLEEVTVPQYADELQLARMSRGGEVTLSASAREACLRGHVRSASRAACARPGWRRRGRRRP